MVLSCTVSEIRRLIALHPNKLLQTGMQTCVDDPYNGSKGQQRSQGGTGTVCDPDSIEESHIREKTVLVPHTELVICTLLYSHFVPNY